MRGTTSQGLVLNRRQPSWWLLCPAMRLPCMRLRRRAIWCGISNRSWVAGIVGHCRAISQLARPLRSQGAQGRQGTAGPLPISPGAAGRAAGRGSAAHRHPGAADSGGHAGHHGGRHPTAPGQSDWWVITLSHSPCVNALAIICCVAVSPICAAWPGMAQAGSVAARWCSAAM
jgi:hypothetical protein